jgi:hypothetical protein
MNEGRYEFMNNERILHALNALAEHDRSREAPPEHAIRIRAEFRLRRARRIWRRAAVGTLAAAAAATMAVMLRTAPEVPEQTSLGVAAVQFQTGTGPQSGASIPDSTPNSASDGLASAHAPQMALAPPVRPSTLVPMRLPAKRASALANSSLQRQEAAVTPDPASAAQGQTDREANQGEIMTDFFPLMNPAPPFDRGQLLRVNLPASAMQIVGLPVREDRMSNPIQADVLVGEEGLPRAIRFIGFDRAQFAGK